jgi:hypothetical protein
MRPSAHATFPKLDCLRILSFTDGRPSLLSTAARRLFDLSSIALNITVRLVSSHVAAVKQKQSVLQQ